MASNFGFGAKPVAPPSFGTSNIPFGTPPTQQPPAGGFQLGQWPTPQATSSTPNLFGNTAPKPSFNTPTATTSSSLFAAPLGQPPTATTKPAFSFLTPSSTAPPFAAATSTPVGNVSFGATTAAPSIQFGLGSTTATTTPSLGLGFGATSIAPSTGFGASIATGTGFNLGTTPATTAATGLGFAIPIATTTTSSLTAASTAPVSFGLGGIASTQIKSSTETTQKELAPKDQPLPNEILQTVEQFKEVVKQQKLHSSEIARCSVRDFRNVEQEINSLNNCINEIQSQLQRNRQLADKLKHDSAQSLQQVEMAQRTHDTPPGLQYENNAPMNFFLNLADQFEQTMQTLKLQIENADKYVKDHSNTEPLTPKDLSLGLKRLHETFVALAGRLHSVHSQVEAQKEAYLSLRKHYLNDTSNPFEALSNTKGINLPKISVIPTPKVATGPTPFSNAAVGNFANQQQGTPPPSYPGTNTAPGFGSTGSFGSALQSEPYKVLFGSSSGSPVVNTSFQLQKPPTGSKRGKVD